MQPRKIDYSKIQGIRWCLQEIYKIAWGNTSLTNEERSNLKQAWEKIYNVHRENYGIGTMTYLGNNQFRWDNEIS